MPWALLYLLIGTLQAFLYWRLGHPFFWSSDGRMSIVRPLMVLMTWPICLIVDLVLFGIIGLTILTMPDIPSYRTWTEDKERRRQLKESSEVVPFLSDTKGD